MIRRLSVLIATFAIFSAPIFSAAWTGPTASAPGSNAAAPLNVGTASQVKNGVIGVNGISVFGNSLLYGTGSGGNAYLNFGTTPGSGGYGIYDNGGTLQFKNSGGSWQSLQAIIAGLGGVWTTSGSNIYYNSGNVGIGTASPGAKLAIASGDSPSILLGPNASYGQYLELGQYGNPSGNASIGVSNGNLHIDSKPGYGLYLNYFSNGGIDIGSGGGGTTIHNLLSSTNGFNETGRVNITGNGSDWAEVVNWGPGAVSGSYGILVGTGYGGYSQFQNQYGYYTLLADSSWGLYTNGNAAAAGFYYYSDRRLKKDIAPLSNTDALSDVLQLQPVTYQWIDPMRGTGTQIGFIAQDVKKIVPELVNTDASTTLETVDYARITPLLTGSVQLLNQKIEEQQSTIASQQKEIDDLNARLTALEAKL